jgi:hypothetical protein
LQRSDTDLFGIAVTGMWLVILAAVASLVAAKQPSNPVGWLLLAAALFIAGGLFFTGYAVYATEFRPGSLPSPQWAAWFSLWLPSPAGPLVVISLLLFPNGRLLSPRWRILVWAVAAASVSIAVGFAVKPGPIDNVRTLSNPLHVSWGDSLYQLANGPLSAVTVVGAIAAIVSLFIRMRGSSGILRQQIKWFVYAVAVFPIFFASGMVADMVLDAQFGSGDHLVDFILIIAGASLIPISLGVSMLRYRLYEIDLIINRTLVYSSLTAILAAVYLGIVVLLQQVMSSVTTDSDIAVAGSTLAVAALFRPLRTRLQSFIDRRFYRRKYDATATLEAFAVRLRDQIDLDALSRELIGVVGSTIHPTHASLWLKTETTR